MRKRKERPRPKPDEEPKDAEPAAPAPQGEPEPEAPPDEPPEEPSLEQKLLEMEDKYRRAIADLANLHKRFQRERERIRHRAIADFVGKLLPMIDNLAHSLNAARDTHDPAALIQGFQLVQAQMLQILRESGIRPIESVGRRFDPDIHHAVTTEITDEVEPGTVTEELGRGFVMDDLVVRPAQVKVAAAPPAAEESGPETPQPQEESET
jgi:molecular chaperone GrpE